MRRGAGAWLLVAALVAAGMPPAVPPAAPPDCVLCGHACCCPELCARKRAARAAESCDRSETSCRLEKDTPGDWTVRGDKFSFPDRPAGEVPSDGDNVVHRGRRETASQVALGSPPFSDVLTPPPRRVIPTA
jgi:hypothetical protein